MRLIKLIEDKETFPVFNKGWSGARYVYASGVRHLHTPIQPKMYGYYFSCEEELLEPLYLFSDKRNEFLKTSP